MLSVIKYEAEEEFDAAGTETLREGRRDYGRKYELDGMMSQPKATVQQWKSDSSSAVQKFSCCHRNRIVIAVSIRALELNKS